MSCEEKKIYNKMYESTKETVGLDLFRCIQVV